MNTFGTRSWVAFLICFAGISVGLYWVTNHGCDFKVFAVYVVGVFGLSVIVTGRSILEDVADIAKAWKGGGKTDDKP